MRHLDIRPNPLTMAIVEKYFTVEPPRRGLANLFNDTELSELRKYATDMAQSFTEDVAESDQVKDEADPDTIIPNSPELMGTGTVRDAFAALLQVTLPLPPPPPPSSHP